MREPLKRALQRPWSIGPERKSFNPLNRLLLLKRLYVIKLRKPRLCIYWPGGSSRRRSGKAWRSTSSTRSVERTGLISSVKLSWIRSIKCTDLCKHLRGFEVQSDKTRILTLTMTGSNQEARRWNKLWNKVDLSYTIQKKESKQGKCGWFHELMKMHETAFSTRCPTWASSQAYTHMAAPPSTKTEVQDWLCQTSTAKKRYMLAYKNRLHHSSLAILRQLEMTGKSRLWMKMHRT